MGRRDRDWGIYYYIQMTKVKAHFIFVHNVGHGVGGFPLGAIIRCYNTSQSSRGNPISSISAGWHLKDQLWQRIWTDLDISYC